MEELLRLEDTGERDTWVLADDNSSTRMRAGGSCANIENISVKQKQGPELCLAKLGCPGPRPTLRFSLLRSWS